MVKGGAQSAWRLLARAPEAVAVARSSPLGVSRATYMGPAAEPPQARAEPQAQAALHEKA